QTGGAAMNHLLSISIGPVQEFIAAARKTGDLQAGSELLADTARTVARAVAPHGTLIFPADPDAKAIANKVLVELHDCEPAEIASQAEEVAREFLRGRWQRARNEFAASDCDDPLAQDQIEHFLEFYAAWVPRSQDYAQDRKQVERLLAGRKALRDFVQPMSREGRPKSPLDPSRDCAIRGNDLGNIARSAGSLRLKEGEALDAVSLLKRAERKDVPSTSMMAAECILPIVREKDAGVLHELADLMRATAGSNDFSDLLYEERTEVLCDELRASNRAAEAEDLAAKARSLRKRVCKLAFGDANRPCPAYYAILAADGDKMGDKLGSFAHPEDHRSFSATLVRFAEHARNEVRNYGGHCVYTGGDDILALLPLNTALDCAAALAREFHDQTEATLSAGIAIVHHLEDLQTSLERARAAERVAKQERDSLAVALHTRGGAPLTVADTWTSEPVKEWKMWAKAFRSGLAHGFPYELLAVAREWRGTGLSAARFRGEAKRILSRKKQAEGTNSGGSQSPELPDFRHLDAWEPFARKLIIARFLSNYPEVKHA
ncbi:MAG: type III-B CRISPR-associated protein Cas10/Cmr2, partial [Chthonomonadales bacterium]